MLRSGLVGFSLIDVVLALVLISVVLLGILTLLEHQAQLSQKQLHLAQLRVEAASPLIPP